MELESISSRQVLGIRFPLARDPIFVEVTDPTQSLEILLIDTVVKLEKAGKPHEAYQLQQALKDHIPFIKGQQYLVDRPIQEIPFQEKFLEGEQVNYAELNLLRKHVGG